MGTKLIFSEPVFVAYLPCTDVAQTFVINKARTHKYISRERKGNRWVYTYAEPQASATAHSEPEPSTRITPEPKTPQLGKTKSGKTVYEGKSALDPAYADFTQEDHYDAAALQTNIYHAGSHSYVGDDHDEHERYKQAWQNEKNRAAQAVGNYVSENKRNANYTVINRVLRGNTEEYTPGQIERAKSFAQVINDKIKESVTDKAVTVYRCAPLPRELKEGDSFKTEGLTSTSASQSYALRHRKTMPTAPMGMQDGILKIRVPKGANLLNVNKTFGSQYPGEKEHLFGSGQAFRVTATKYIDGVLHVDAVAVDADDKTLAMSMHSQRPTLLKGSGANRDGNRFNNDPGFFIIKRNNTVTKDVRKSTAQTFKHSDLQQRPRQFLASPIPAFKFIIYSKG